MSLVGIVQSGFESHRSHASATTWRSQQQPPLPFERRGYWSAAIAGTDLARCELAVRAQLEEALRELNRRPTAHMCMQITGGTGFLGSHLIHQLCTSADLTPLELPLTILYTHHSQSPLVLPDGPPHVTVTAGKVDLTKGEEVENMFLKCTPDVVVHTAAMSNTGFCDKNPDVAAKNNTEATQNIVRAAEKLAKQDHRVHIIHFSTDWAYDGADAHSVETNPNTHGFGVYGQTKLGGEQAIQSIQPSKGVTWTILRSALMYGAPSPLTGKHSFLKFMIDGLRSEEGISLFSDEYRTPVPVPFILSVLRRIIHDVTSPAASAAASSDAETNSSSNSSCSSSSVWTNQIFNMGGPERMSRHAMGEILCRVLSAPLSRCRPITLEEAGLAQARPGDLSMNSEKLYGAMRGVRPGRFEEEFRKLGL